MAHSALFLLFVYWDGALAARSDYSFDAAYTRGGRLLFLDFEALQFGGI